MVAHRYTLRWLTAELSPFVLGGHLEAAYRRGRHELFLRCHSPTGEGFTVEVLLRPGISTFFRLPARWEMPQQLLPWAEELWGARIEGLELEPMERCVRWSFAKGWQLLLFLLGTAHSGALLLNAEGSTHASMGAEREELERLYRERGQRRPQWWEFPVQTAVSYALARGREGLGTFYARQLCYRCGIDPEAPLGSLTAEQYARLEEGLRAFCGELQDSRCALLLRRPGSSPLLSLVPLQEYPEVVRSFASIHEAVAECVRQRLLWEELQRRRAELQQTLERYHRQVLSQLEAADVHQQQAERVELYRLWGTLLLAQPNLRQRGQEQLELPDWEGRLHRIELDPAKTVQENAERYFRQARRLEESVQRAQQRIPQLRALRERLEQLLQEVQRADSLRYVQHLARQVAELFPPREVQTPTGERFRVFPLGKGFTLYVGKDARSNEALTFGFARPHDLFLHVRQGSGAHGILRGGAKGQLPPEEILRQAAAIVAYYSSARTADWVPVLYTWRKYVRKVKGVPGAVRTEREELVWVEPRAPTE